MNDAEKKAVAEQFLAGLDEYLPTVFNLRDGKISAIDSYLSDVSLVNAFFVK
jgi:hypothetical protein